LSETLDEYIKQLHILIPKADESTSWIDCTAWPHICLKTFSRYTPASKQQDIALESLEARLQLGPNLYTQTNLSLPSSFPRVTCISPPSCETDVFLVTLKYHSAQMIIKTKLLQTLNVYAQLAPNPHGCPRCCRHLENGGSEGGRRDNGYGVLGEEMAIA
jgi:hypothetical protein